MPQQLSTPFEFEISERTGQLHRSSDAGTEEPESVVQSHVSVPPVTEQFLHEPEYVPPGAPHETGASGAASADWASPPEWLLRERFSG